MFKLYVAFCSLFITMNAYCQYDNSFQDNYFPSRSLSIRTNIPTWLIGIPSLGISYKTSERLEFNIDGAFSYWNFQRKGTPHYWRTWNISPQVRTYVNHDRSTYLGTQFSVGQYNISSQQGNYFGGGISVGKQYYAGKKLLIDLGLTLGYLRFTDRKSYTSHDNVFYTNRVTEDSNYWGPTSVSIKLSRKVN